MKKSQITLIVLLILIGIIVVFALVRPHTSVAPTTPVVQTPPTTTPVSTTQTYHNDAKGISTISYPVGYTLDDSYVYQALGPGKDINGVKFTIPASVTLGTNLGSDSYVSVEELPGLATCSAAPFVSPGAPVSTVTDQGIPYSMAVSGDAGAGNRYDETVYALMGTSPCIAVRYFVHYVAIENYPAGAVKEFDKQALLDQFDQIRRTLVVTQ